MSIPKPTERDVQAVCLQWLRLFGAVVVRVNSGAMKVGKRLIRLNSEPGCSDALVCLPGDGRFCAIEFKRPGGKPTPAQASFLAAVRAAGGLAVVATSLDDLRRQLKDLGYDVGVK